MLTYYLFREIISEFIMETTIWDVFIFIFLCILSIPIDIVLLPIELISGLIYLYIKYIKKRIKEEEW